MFDYCSVCDGDRSIEWCELCECGKLFLDDLVIDDFCEDCEFWGECTVACDDLELARFGRW
jgi:hypothetical protein